MKKQGYTLIEVIIVIAIIEILSAIAVFGYEDGKVECSIHRYENDGGKELLIHQVMKFRGCDWMFRTS